MGFDWVEKEGHDACQKARPEKPLNPAETEQDSGNREAL